MNETWHQSLFFPVVPRARLCEHINSPSVTRGLSGAPWRPAGDAVAPDAISGSAATPGPHTGLAVSARSDATSGTRQLFRDGGAEVFLRLRRSLLVERITVDATGNESGYAIAPAAISPASPATKPNVAACRAVSATMGADHCGADPMDPGTLALTLLLPHQIAVLEHGTDDEQPSRREQSAAARQKSGWGSKRRERT